MNPSNYFNEIKRIAIVASPETRKDFIEWSYASKNILKNHLIISTARTAAILEGTLNTPVMNLRHGKSGGYQQVKTLMEENKIDLFIFFGNQLHAEHKDSWFEELVKVAVEKDIVVAYNPATIEMLLTSIAIRHEDSARESHHHEFLHNEIFKASDGLNNAQH